MISAEIFAPAAPTALSQARQVVLQAGLTPRVPNESVVAATNSPAASPKVDQVVITPDDEGMKLLNGYVCSSSFLSMFECVGCAIN
jgi:hypothetical protein